jgi:hypothetical protein
MEIKLVLKNLKMETKELRDKIMKASEKGNFTYSSYWQNWSRILARNNPNGKYVELNLTPIGGHDFNTEVAPMIIRAHETQRRSNDSETHRLPEKVVGEMMRNLGLETTYQLLSYDFLSEIDWNKYHEKCNGGASFNDIRKTKSLDNF